MRNLLLMTTMFTAPLYGETLSVYTYDSFASEWGPGPVIEKGFEATCKCDVVFTPAGDGAAMLTRLKLEGSASTADVALGLDQNLAESARETGLFLTLENKPQEINDAGVTWNDPDFQVYDWGYFGFVYRKKDISSPPKNFEELADSNWKIVIEDPRASTPGLGLALWIKTVYGEKAEEFWGRLSDNIVTVTPGWTEAYALFLSGEADMVLSYTSSPAYHRIAEKDDGFGVAKFDEGHGMQIELSGVLKASKNPKLAQEFLEYLRGVEAQTALISGNWMYPVMDVKLPDGFDAPSSFKALETARDKPSIEAAIAAHQNGM